MATRAVKLRLCKRIFFLSILFLPLFFFAIHLQQHFRSSAQHSTDEGIRSKAEKDTIDSPALITYYRRMHLLLARGLELNYTAAAAKEGGVIFFLHK